MCLLGKRKIIDNKKAQNYIHGKYAYWGKLESLIRNETRTISIENFPTGTRIIEDMTNR
jgi:hypothetical protein